MSPARMIVNETKAKAMKDRPDLKLTSKLLTSPSILEPEVLEEGRNMMKMMMKVEMEMNSNNQHLLSLSRKC